MSMDNSYNLIVDGSCLDKVVHECHNQECLESWSSTMRGVVLSARYTAFAAHNHLRPAAVTRCLNTGLLIGLPTV